MYKTRSFINMKKLRRVWLFQPWFTQSNNR